MSAGPSRLLYLESTLAMPGMALPVRSAYAPVEGGGVLFSPGSKLTEAQLRSLPVVTDIVGTNLLHCGGVGPAARIHPQARLWAPPGGRAAKHQIAWTHELGRDAWPFESELALIALDGMPKLSEVVFVHRASKTLIVSDLCFNMIDASGAGAWLVLHLFGTYRRFAVSRLMLRAVSDRRRFCASLQKLLGHDFEAIAVNHGAIIDSDGRAQLRRAFEERGLEMGPGPPDPTDENR